MKLCSYSIVDKIVMVRILRLCQLRTIQLARSVGMAGAYGPYLYHTANSVFGLYRLYLSCHQGIALGDTIGLVCVCAAR
jgi:hypothetical protein